MLSVSASPRGADVNGPDRHKRTALHLAAYAGPARRHQVPDRVRRQDSRGRPWTASHRCTSRARRGTGRLPGSSSTLGANQKALNYKGGERAPTSPALSGNQKLVEMLLRKQVNPCHRSKTVGSCRRSVREGRGRTCDPGGGGRGQGGAHLIDAGGHSGGEGRGKRRRGRAAGAPLDPRLVPSIGHPRTTGHRTVHPDRRPHLTATGTEPSLGPSGHRSWSRRGGRARHRSARRSPRP